MVPRWCRPCRWWRCPCLSSEWVSPPAEGPGLAQSVSLSRPRLWGRAGAHSSEDPGQWRSVEPSVSSQYSALSRQPHLVCDLALTCYHPCQLCEYCQVWCVSQAAWRPHRVITMDYLHPVGVHKTVILDQIQKTFNKNQSEEISSEIAL